LLARRAEIEALATDMRFANQDLAAQTAGLRAEADRLAREARDLRALLDGLEQAAAGEAAPDRLPSTRPPRTAPAAGELVRAFSPSGAGGQPGVALATRAGAQVVSPGDARVAFAADFRSYGRMLILDVGADELVIMSGLDALYPEAGQWVLAGEPVGRMADSTRPSPELYLEVRRRGEPVDPAAWLDPDA
jgi:septal ring factor EnvC (AmiA/AmiB activator)